MKSACHAAAFCVALAGASFPMRADPAPAVSLTPAAPATSLHVPLSIARSPSSSEVDPFAGADPETIIQHSAEVREEFIRANSIDDAETAARQQAYANDWMLRDYSARLKSQGLSSSTDRDLEAEIQVPDPSAPPTTGPNGEALPASETDPLKRPLSDANGEAPPAATPEALALPPLLPALAGPASTTTTVTRLDAWGSRTVAVAVLPDPINPDLLSPGNPGSLRPRDTANGTESFLDVPGLTAERQGLADPSEMDLPDQQVETATENDNRPRKDFLLPTVASNNSSDFFKHQAEALAAPNAPIHPASLPGGNIPLGPSLPPLTLTAKVPVTTGIRSHVPDPFDLIGGHRDPSSNGSW